MIKLVASDLDGTLLLNGAQALDERSVKAIRKLIDKGIYFAPASGRQIISLKRLFEPVGAELIYIADNGSYVEYKGEQIAKTAIDRELGLKIIEDAYSLPNCEVMVSGVKAAYFKPKTKEYEHRMTEVVNYNIEYVDSYEDIPEDMLKIAVCDLTGIDNSSDYLKKRWCDKAAGVVSGKLYMDFMDMSVSKGKAIRQIKEYFSLKDSECMAFGDNFNDCAMLDEVANSYVMESAVSAVKAHGRYSCSCVADVLERLVTS